MKEAYTHPFPERRLGTLLGGISYVLLAYDWQAAVPDWNFPRVLSPYWRLLHSRTPGGVVVCMGGRRIALTARNMVLVPSDVETALSAACPIEMLWSHFLVLMPPLLRIRMEVRHPFELTLDAPCATLIEHMIGQRARRAPRPTDRLLFRALLDLCMAQLLERVPAGGSGDPADIERVEVVLAHLQTHCAERLDNKALGALVGVGKDQLMKLFRRVAGKSPHTCLTEVRLNAASRALVETRKSIKQIAVECGFANRYYFTRVFRNRMGMGPAGYRRRFHALSGVPPGRVATVTGRGNPKERRTREVKTVDDVGDPPSRCACYGEARENGLRGEGTQSSTAIVAAIVHRRGRKTGENGKCVVSH